MLLNVNEINWDARGRTKNLIRNTPFVVILSDETNANFFNKIKFFQSKIYHEVVFTQDFGNSLIKAS